MTYAPHSKNNSSQQNQQQTAKATAQTFSDNRESTSASSPLQAMMANSPQQQKLKSTAQLMANSPAQKKLNSTSQNFANTSEPIQRMDDEEPLQGKFETESEPAQLEATSEAPRPNNTGLPDNLKAGIENLSGMSMDHVRVHYNSDKPAQLQAHAYAQGGEIHVAPGQEQHLPHEAWHVVQQAQGRVKPTMQMKGDVQVNDYVGLEEEADLMGGWARELSTSVVTTEKSQMSIHGAVGLPIQRVMNKAGITNKQEQKLKLRTTVYLYAELDGNPVGSNGVFNSTTGAHAEQNLLNYLTSMKLTGQTLKIWLTASPCSETFGTGTGCNEALEKYQSDTGTNVEVEAAHLYQPKTIQSMEVSNGYPSGFVSHGVASSSAVDTKIAHLPKTLQDEDMQSEDYVTSDQVIQLYK